MNHHLQLLNYYFYLKRILFLLAFLAIDQYFMFIHFNLYLLCQYYYFLKQYLKDFANYYLC